MSRRFRFVRIASAGLLLLALVAASAAAQPRKRSARSMEERRTRWEAMSEEKKQELRRRLEEFHRLSPAEQERIRARAERLADLRESIRENLPPELRERMPLDRRLLEGHLGETSAFLREHLPPEALERLKAMPPREREQVLREHLDGMLAKRVERFLEQPPPWLPPEDAARLRDLPPRERWQEIAARHKDHLVARVEGDPALLSKISPEGWERMKSLPPHKFLSRFFLWKRGVEKGFGTPGRERGFGPPGPRREFDRPRRNGGR